MRAGFAVPYPPGAEEERTRTPPSIRIRAIQVIRRPMPGPFWMPDKCPSPPTSLCVSRASVVPNQAVPPQRPEGHRGRDSEAGTEGFRQPAASVSIPIPCAPMPQAHRGSPWDVGLSPPAHPSPRRAWRIATTVKCLGSTAVPSPLLCPITLSPKPHHK